MRVNLDGDEQVVRDCASARSRPGVPGSARRQVERILYSFRATSADAVSRIVPNLVFEELDSAHTEITQKPSLVSLLSTTDPRSVDKNRPNFRSRAGGR